MTARQAFDALGLPDVHFQAKPPDALLALSTNNDLPQEHDVPPIRAFLATAEQELASCPPGGVKKALKRRLAGYRAALSPIRRLPPEVLGEIFLFVVQDVRHGCIRTIGGEYRVPGPPWRLAMVCRSWRASALSFSQLWSSIMLFFPPFPYADIRTIRTYFPIEGIRKQIERSGDAPLHVAVQLSLPDSEHHIKLFDLVLKQSSRITKLTLGWDQSWPQRSVMDCLRRVKDQLARLRDVELRPADDVDVDGYDGYNGYGSGYENEPQYSRVPLNWAQLTRLRVCLSVPADFEVVRLAAQSLIECTLEIRESNFELGIIPLGNPDLSLPHLQRLSVLFCGSDEPEDERNEITADESMLRGFVAHNLEYLSLVNVSPITASDLLQRSQCDLLGLRLHVDDNDFGRNSARAVDILRQLPGLRKLEVSVVVIEGEDSEYGARSRSESKSGLSYLLAALTHHNDNEALCPKLETLRIQRVMPHFTIPRFDWDSEDEDDEDRDADTSASWSPRDVEALQAMVRSRSALKYVSVRMRMVDGSVGEGLRAEFERMKGSGVVVRYEETDWIGLGLDVLK
uniref:F-box domain-containing protein n=1 Tax=Mycena chlorophos TaxID=658473 RepID=A0ABQ0LJZ9_MYCCL|nr:predicted protein [Mycena chlorophos]